MEVAVAERVFVVVRSPAPEVVGRLASDVGLVVVAVFASPPLLPSQVAACIGVVVAA